jgi:hypothetical protein
MHKEYDCRGSVAKISGHEPQGIGRQDELISDKRPVEK